MKPRVLIFFVNNYNTTCNIILPNKTACHCLPHDVESRLEQCSKPSDDSCQLPFSIILFSQSFRHASAAWVLASAVRCAMAGTSVELPRRSVFRGMFSAHPIMILIVHKRVRGASAKGLSILSSARPSAVLPRLQFQLPRRYCKPELIHVTGVSGCQPIHFWVLKDCDRRKTCREAMKKPNLRSFVAKQTRSISSLHWQLANIPCSHLPVGVLHSEPYGRGCR